MPRRCGGSCRRPSCTCTRPAAPCWALPACRGDYLAGIFVDGPARSRGVGRQLLDRCKALHPVLTLHVYRQNPRAAAFYRREGFAVAAEGIDPDTGQPELTMVWRRG